MTTRICLCPVSVLGSSPTKFIPIFQNGMPMTVRGKRGALCLDRWADFWHSGHEKHNFFTSVWTPGQKYSSRILWVVRSRPRWLGLCARDSTNVWCSLGTHNCSSSSLIYSSDFLHRRLFKTRNSESSFSYFFQHCLNNSSCFCSFWKCTPLWSSGCHSCKLLKEL